MVHYIARETREALVNILRSFLIPENKLIFAMMRKTGSLK